MTLAPPVGRHRHTPDKFKYQQLAQCLAAEIRASYQPGDRLHSEPDLCARFEVTRNTIRKSIDMLAAQGLVERRGRAGNFIADFRRLTWDDRLICVALPIRNHLWDQLFLSLSQHSIAYERFALISDFTGFNIGNSFGELLPREQRLKRLTEALDLRPRTLVLAEADLLADSRELQTNFRNLIVVHGEPLIGLEHVANVRIDQPGCWRLAGRHARQVGYQRLAIILPGGNTHVARLQEDLAEAESGSFSLADQRIFFEHHPSWREDLCHYILADDRPVAVITSYDWGAHLVLQVLRQRGIDIPLQAGIYGMNNTPWSMMDQITSVHVDPDTWAETIFQADQALSTGDACPDLLVPPIITERDSTHKQK